MLFKYIDYSEKFVEITESLIDETAINNTGCDEGVHHFYNYWLEESDTILNQNFWCKLAFGGNELIGVICLGLSPTKEFTIMEIIVAPNKRGKGLGSSIIHELIDNSEKIIGKEIETAKAVIFPNNIASKKAFEKAGFLFTGSHPDGDALYYTYAKGAVTK